MIQLVVDRSKYLTLIAHNTIHKPGHLYSRSTVRCRSKCTTSARSCLAEKTQPPNMDFLASKGTLITSTSPTKATILNSLGKA